MTIVGAGSLSSKRVLVPGRPRLRGEIIISFLRQAWPVMARYADSRLGRGTSTPIRCSALRARAIRACAEWRLVVTGWVGLSCWAPVHHPAVEFGHRAGETQPHRACPHAAPISWARSGGRPITLRRARRSRPPTVRVRSDSRGVDDCSAFRSQGFDDLAEFRSGDCTSAPTVGSSRKSRRRGGAVRRLQCAGAVLPAPEFLRATAEFGLRPSSSATSTARAKPAGCESGQPGRNTTSSGPRSRVG